MIDVNKKILVTGSTGMVGSSIVRILKKNNFKNLLTPSSKELDLFDTEKTKKYFKGNKPELIFAAAARVGGIIANSKYPADFMMENLLIQNNTIITAHKFDINNLIFFGSSCIYPKFAKQPLKEEYLLEGQLEKTNEPYAVAKITGLKLCESLNKQYGRNYISVMPSNLYGKNDNYNVESSHVLPALINKIHYAKMNNKKEITIFGSGKPLREFLFVDELAEACYFLMNKKHDYKIINIGSGEEISILDLAKLISKILDYSVKIICDKTKPDGTSRKLLDSKLINNLGWTPKVFLNKGIELTYNDYCNNNPRI